jgi:hypothetical protein
VSEHGSETVPENSRGKHHHQESNPTKNSRGKIINQVNFGH